MNGSTFEMLAVSPTSQWVFVANGNGISGLRLAVDGAGNPSLATQWQKSGGGFSPMVANHVLYYAGSNNVRALDPTTGNPLWSNTTIGAIHWQSPTLANSTKRRSSSRV